MKTFENLLWKITLGKICINLHVHSQYNFALVHTGSLWTHLKTHSGEKCKQCDFAFFHLKTKSGEKLYKCKQCDFAPATSSDFRNRKKTHTGEKSHLCTYLIFVLFSPQTKFLAQFFFTSKNVNSDKTA